MAKKEESKHREIIQKIRKGEFSPVYILSGDEAYYIDLIVANLEKYAVDEADRDFNYNVFYGVDADVDYVLGVARQFPVMAPRKLVILKEAQGMHQAKVQLDKFQAYVGKPSSSTIFVITYKGDKLSGTSKLIKAAAKGGATVFNSVSPRDYELPAVIRDYCRERKTGIEDKAVFLLAENIGLPLSKLFAEINKLISIKGQAGGNITADDIERNIGISKDYNNFELSDALAEKDYLKAVKIMRYFSANPKTNPTPVVTATLFNFYSDLVIAHYLPNKSEASLKEAFGYRAAVQVRKMQSALRNYTPMQAVNAIHYIREFDTKSKGIDSMQNEYNLLTDLLFKLFT